MQRKEEVLIAGAGLAGMTAAINLALYGCRVIIFDKGKEVGSCFNDDFQGLENYSTPEDVIGWLAEMHRPTDFAATGFTEMETVDGGGAELSSAWANASTCGREKVVLMSNSQAGIALDGQSFVLAFQHCRSND